MTGSEEGVQEAKVHEDRKAKAEQLRALQVNPFGNGFRPTHTAAQVLAAHREHDAVALEASRPGPYRVAGRIVGLRSFGKAAFIVLQDRTGALQVHVKADAVGERQYAAFKLVELADFVGVEGTAFRSKTGELTLAATTLRPLTKALRPLPGKFAKDDEARAWAEKQALADVEQRYRQRYLDLLSNPGVKETFVRRSKLVRFIRQYLDARDYLEVETPMMHPLVSGAAARPFRTHHNALDIDLYLRIAPELYLKRLVVGGFDRVYEINRNFRNEGISTRHNPEFTMLEFYEAYATYVDLMDLTEDMLSEVALAVTGATAVKYGEHTIDFKRGWRRIPMFEALRERLPELGDRDASDEDKLRALARRGASEGEQAVLATMSRGELVGHLFERYVEATLVQPTFVTEFPIDVSPLARRSDERPELADRFELFCAGREIANAFSELNDPVDQAQRFRAQLEAKARGRDETMDYDADYVRALEHGLPPTAGEGIGIDRLVMLLTDAPSIRDVILFPLQKPQA